jgi:hypothetical protein
MIIVFNVWFPGAPNSVRMIPLNKVLTNPAKAPNIIQSFPPCCAQGVIFAIAFAKDGSRCCAASDDRSVRVWNIADVLVAELYVLLGASGHYRSLAGFPHHCEIPFFFASAKLCGFRTTF